MFTVERLVDHGWTREFRFKTEFKALINARSQCMATGDTYRVINRDRTVVCVITLDDCKRRLRARSAPEPMPQQCVSSSASTQRLMVASGIDQPEVAATVRGRCCNRNASIQS